jgi:outer membrane protein assembly factor BamE (lipoprotein component of BamABCDE complex)
MFFLKNHKYIYSILVFFILIGCKLQDPNKNHGILFLENRSNKLTINSTNKNDVINIIGYPHTKSINDNDTWVYVERVLSKGSYHKLGQHVLKENNILILKFDKFGVLKEKKILDKNDKEKIAFSNKETANDLSKKSFVSSFLQSIKQKMYGNK